MFWVNLHFVCFSNFRSEELYHGVTKFAYTLILFQFLDFDKSLVNMNV